MVTSGLVSLAWGAVVPFLSVPLVLARLAVRPDDPLGAMSTPSADAGRFERFVCSSSLRASRTDEEQARPTRRAPPDAFPSPPFPGSDYPGVPVVGVRDTEEFPLMRGARGTEVGDWLHERRIKVMGWVNVSANASTSRDSNLPDAFAIRANRGLELQQALLRLERVPDSVQRDHVDWGIRVDQLYGLDYRYTTMKGIFSEQLLQRDQTYGYDPVMVYGEIYHPDLGEGTIFKFGRFILLPGIEAEVSPYNYMFSHSLLYTYFPYTQMGVLATTRFSDQWTVQVGLTAGSDVAVWEQEAELTPITGWRWVSEDNDDSLYLCTITNSGEASYNNVQVLDLVWSHRFNADIHTLTEVGYFWQRDVPAFGDVDWYGAMNYLVLRLNDESFLTLRNELWNDSDGQRTGFDTLFSTHALGVNYKPFDWLYIRPELKYSHAYDQAAYDSGRDHDQLVALVDMVVRF